MKNQEQDDGEVYGHAKPIDTVQIVNPEKDDDYMVVNKSWYVANKEKKSLVLWDDVKPKEKNTAPPVEEAVDVEIPDDWENLTVPELKKLAIALDVADVKEMRKAELVEAIGELVEDA